MHVGEVELINFTAHKRSKFVLPKTGVLLITGINGAGKSSVIEGVSYAGWGKTLRGTAPWKGEARPACTARLCTDQLNITRSREGKKTELAWEDWEAVAREYPGASSDDKDEYDTPSKADAALQQLLGPFNLWRRSHVFSSADAAHFTTATDKERKQLIESFLGNDRFDPALEACRADLKQSRTRQAELERALAVEGARVQGEEQRIADTRKQIDSLVEPPPPPVMPEGRTLKELDALLSKVRREVGDLRSALRDADRAGAGHDATARQAQQMLERLRADKCPTCAQAITPEMRRTEKAKADQAAALAEQAKSTARAQVAEVEAAVAEAERAIQHLQHERDKRAGEAAIVSHARQERTRYDATMASLTSTFEAALAARKKARAKLVTLEEELDMVSSDVDELEAVEVVLGVKGVRAHILGKSLGGIEAIANLWLARLYHPKRVHVTLKPYSELKKGGFDDSISFEVEGVGEGLGYRAASGGERRRLDVAMLLAMAEVASAARGVAAGTLWFDEVLDALDAAGVDAVIEAMRELSRERCVVIITHLDMLVSGLRPFAAKHLHIQNGEIVE